MSPVNVEPSLENLGTLTTIVLAIVGFFSWIFGSAKRAFIVIMKSEIAIHVEQERLIHEGYNNQLIRLDERTSVVMDNLCEIREDIKMLIKKSDRHRSDDCPFMDEAAEEQDDSN